MKKLRGVDTNLYQVLPLFFLHYFGFLSGYFLTSVAFPDIDILHPAVLSHPPKTMCLYNYYIAYVREGTILKVVQIIHLCVS